ncbi:MAG: DUF1566 domain-containing protein [Polyangia bacterium]
MGRSLLSLLLAFGFSSAVGSCGGRQTGTPSGTGGRASTAGGPGGSAGSLQSHTAGSTGSGGGTDGSTGVGGASSTGGAIGAGGSSGVDGGSGATCSYQPAEWIVARWPMPNPAASGLPNPSSYTDNGDGTVKDNVTGLVWQKSVASTQVYAWCDAIAYCASLQLAGRTWHLPTRIELLSIVDFLHTSPAIDTTAFPGTPGGKYHWTSSPWVVSQIASKPQYSWIVNFYEGLTSNAGGRTLAEYARCVSSPTNPLPAQRYTQVATGEVQDVETGLIWVQASSSATMAFDAAQTYCSTLNLNGHTWRVPSIKELSTLVDEVPPISKVSPAIDTTTFPDTSSSGPYWSSSLFGGQAATAHDPWVINYMDGFTEYNQTAALVRCVR